MQRFKRPQILAGMALGALWGVLVTGLPQWLGLPYIPAPIALPGAFLAPGLVLALMIGRLAQRRFFDDALIGGQPFAPGSAADTDQRVLANTVEQLVLALAVWPFAAVTLGGAVAIALGLSFACMRIVFWAGCHLSLPLRALGFAGTFYPTVIAGIWAAALWL
ncbi:MAPEG family protein [Leisingera daeponensis]|uniref:MAPEG family protein n=1 Tax=Leisingera daeponensis TaxID=405746 RepID=A0ABS7NCA7_9RHOB|nr:MAPEG family protein [Leisingera daeponensis]MBY6138842.1 MAPEG family protein [Leisingera daeponensis]